MEIRNPVRMGVALLLLLAAAPDARAQVDIEEWPVPWQDTRPRDPFMDQAGRVWFVGQVGNYIAYLDPKSGEFKRYTIETGTLPHNVIVHTDGSVWYAGNANARIGRLNAADGRIETFMMPDAAARDPHTLTFDASGDLWFTVQGGNYIGRLKPATGKVDLVKVPTAGARPYGIAIDSKGRPWINLFGSHKLATVDPASLALTEIDLPRTDARTRRIAVTADDRVWYVDYMGGALGVYDPATRKFQEWPLPSGDDARPYAMTSDSRGRLWVVETGVQPNMLVGFDPKNGAFFGMTPIPSGGRVVRHMTFNPATNEIWFGTDAGTIGRAVIP